MILTLDRLKSIMPALPINQAIECLSHLNAAMEQFEINKLLRVSAFLGNLAVESGQLTKLEENLNYSADRLLVVWPKRFNAGLAKECAHNPEKIANVAYSKRYGNGDIASGDGYGYRGRGYIQLTFKDNYLAAGNALGVDLVANPDLLLQPEWAAKSSAWFFKTNGCNELADRNKFDELVEKINSAKLHLEERRAFYHKGIKVLGN